MEKQHDREEDALKEELINTPDSSQKGFGAVKERKDGKTLNQDVDNHIIIYFYLFAVLGLVNNAGYVMVGTAAHDLSIEFDKANWMPSFGLSEIVFGSLVRFVNSKYLINIKHSYRLIANSIVMIVAYLLLAAITIKPIAASFYIALLCALLHGMTSSFGESTILGFLKGFPSKLVGRFSSGTGMAGVFGSGIFLVLQPFMSNGFIFLIATPMVLIYLLNVIIISRKKATLPFVGEDAPRTQERQRSIQDQNNTNNGESENSRGAPIAE